MSRHIAIITTTINHPEKVFETLATGGHLIVAGDMKTPPETEPLVKRLGGTYLRPVDQEKWHCSDVIGWNSIQRRNIAFLEAARSGAEVIIAVDDDNFPENDLMRDSARDWADDHAALLLDRKVQSVISTTNGWYNPGSRLHPEIIARGMPYEMVHEPYYSTYISPDSSDTKVGVNAGLWLGDPDIDALQRIVKKPDVYRADFVHNTHVRRGIWSPINSQNTAWRPETLPLACVLPGVGRWDDILGGYLAEWSMWAADYVVSYGMPLVRQDRNEHDLWKDLALETPWIPRTIPWTQMLKEQKATGDPLTDLELAANLLEIDPTKTYAKVAQFLRAWIADWRSIK